MNDESIDTYQVTVSCRATNEAAIKRVFKILSGFGEAWKPGLLFMTSSLSDKNKTSPYKLGEIAFFLDNNPLLIHTFTLTVNIVSQYLPSSVSECVLDLHETGVVNT